MEIIKTANGFDLQSIASKFLNTTGLSTTELEVNFMFPDFQVYLELSYLVIMQVRHIILWPKYIVNRRRW